MCHKIPVRSPRGYGRGRQFASGKPALGSHVTASVLNRSSVGPSPQRSTMMHSTYQGRIRSGCVGCGRANRAPLRRCESGPRGAVDDDVLGLDHAGSRLNLAVPTGFPKIPHATAASDSLAAASLPSTDLEVAGVQRRRGDVNEIDRAVGSKRELAAASAVAGQRGKRLRLFVYPRTCRSR